MYCDETKEMVINIQTVCDIENCKLSNGGPRQRQALGTGPPMKALCQGRHLV